jgi:hypothetical protein
MPAAADALSDPETKATVLHSLALSVFGDTLYGEDAPDPLEVFAELEDTFRSEISDENQNRLQAIMLAVGSEAFYEDEVAFMAVAESLLDGDLGDLPQGRAENLSQTQVVWAVYEVALNINETREFSPEIERIFKKLQVQEASDWISGAEALIELQRTELVEQMKRVWGSQHNFDTFLPSAKEILTSSDRNTTTVQ